VLGPVFFGIVQKAPHLPLPQEILIKAVNPYGRGGVERFHGEIPRYLGWGVLDRVAYRWIDR